MRHDSCHVHASTLGMPAACAAAVEAAQLGSTRPKLYHTQQTQSHSEQIATHTYTATATCTPTTHTHASTRQKPLLTAKQQRPPLTGQRQQRWNNVCVPRSTARWRIACCRAGCVDKPNRFHWCTGTHQLHCTNKPTTPRREHEQIGRTDTSHVPASQTTSWSIRVTTGQHLLVVARKGRVDSTQRVGESGLGLAHGHKRQQQRDHDSTHGGSSDSSVYASALDAD